MLTVTAQNLSLGDHLHKIHLHLRGLAREALLDGVGNGGADLLALGGGVSLDLLLLGAGLATLVAAEVAAELSVAAALVVEVGGVGWRRGRGLVLGRRGLSAT